MLKTIVEATQNFCTHQINEKSTINGNITKTRTLIAYIDIDTQDDKKYRVYLACDNDFIQKVSKLFLEEDESDEETLIDMTLETTNLIVGSAKVIAQKANMPYVIDIPHFEKIGQFDFKYDEITTVMIDGCGVTIAIKESNG